MHPAALRIEACKLFAAVPCETSVAELERLAQDPDVGEAARTSLSAVKVARQQPYAAISDF